MRLRRVSTHLIGRWCWSLLNSPSSWVGLEVTLLDALLLRACCDNSSGRSSRWYSTSPFEASDEDSEPDVNGCLEHTPTGNDDSDFEDLGVEPPYKKVRIVSERQRLGREDNVRRRGRGFVCLPSPVCSFQLSITCDVH